MKLSFSTASFYHWPLRFTLGLARELAFDGVELVIGPEYLLRGQRNPTALPGTGGEAAEPASAAAADAGLADESCAEYLAGGRDGARFWLRGGGDSRNRCLGGGKSSLARVCCGHAGGSGEAGAADYGGGGDQPVYPPQRAPCDG